MPRPYRRASPRPYRAEATLADANTTAAATIAKILLVMSFSILSLPLRPLERPNGTRAPAPVVLIEMCGINAFGIAEIAKGLFGCAEQSKVVRSESPRAA